MGTLNTKRNCLMDIMKGLGVIAIVVGHANQGEVSHFVYLYHMPLFFFISGYFYNDAYSQSVEGIITLIKKRIKSLYWPYLKYSLVFLCLHNLFFKIHIYGEDVLYGDKIIHPYTIEEFIKTLLKVLLFASREPMGAIFWFFTVLFFINIGFSIIGFISYHLSSNQRTREYLRFSLVLASFMFGNVLTYLGVTIPRFNNTLVMVIVFYTGFMFKKYEDKVDTKNKYIAGFCLVGLLFNMLYGSVAVNTNHYLSPDFLLVNMALGVYVNYYCSYVIANHETARKAISYIGKNSIIIIALHFLCFKIVDLLQIYLFDLSIDKLASFPMINSGGCWWIVYTFVGLIIPIMIQFIKDNINNKLVKR